MVWWIVLKLTERSMSSRIILRRIEMNQSVSALGDAVRAMRKERNLSQEVLAERIGVCKRTIIDIENHTGNPKFEILCMLVRELNLPLYEVFYPEMTENLEVKNLIMEELNVCSNYEMEIILTMIKSLRNVIRNERLGWDKALLMQVEFESKMLHQD